MGFHPEFTGRENARMNAALLGLDGPGDPPPPAGDPRLRRARRLLRPARADLLLGHGPAPGLRGRDARRRRRPHRGRGARGGRRLLPEEVDRPDHRVPAAAAARSSSARTRSTTWPCSAIGRSGSRRARWPRRGRRCRSCGRYEAFLQEKERALAEDEPPRRLRRPRPTGRRPARFTEVLVHDGSGYPRTEFAAGETLAVDLAFETDDPALAFHVRVGADREDGVQAFAMDTRHEPWAPLTGRRRYRVRLLLPELPIAQGEFRLYAFLGDEKRSAPPRPAHPAPRFLGRLARVRRGPRPAAAGLVLPGGGRRSRRGGRASAAARREVVTPAGPPGLAG